MKQAVQRFGKSDLQRLGRHLRDLRLASGRTQAAVAAGAGLAESTVRAVEAGRSNPNLPTILALAATLGTSIDQMLASVAVTPHNVAITRMGASTWDLSAGLDDCVLHAREVVLDQGMQHSPAADASAKGAIMAMVLHGIVLAIAATGERLRLDTGDTCHARVGTLNSLAGLGPQPARVLSVSDPRGTR